MWHLACRFADSFSRGPKSKSRFGSGIPDKSPLIVRFRGFNDLVSRQIRFVVGDYLGRKIP